MSKFNVPSDLYRDVNALEEYLRGSLEEYLRGSLEEYLRGSLEEYLRGSLQAAIVAWRVADLTSDSPAVSTRRQRRLATIREIAAEAQATGINVGDMIESLPPRAKRILA